MMTNILETKRPTLQHPAMDDEDGLFRLYSDPEMRHYFPEGALHHEDTKEELEWHMK
jgi:RimJ/RimL family protein N-acetyltransferase